MQTEQLHVLEWCDKHTTSSSNEESMISFISATNKKLSWHRFWKVTTIRTFCRVQIKSFQRLLHMMHQTIGVSDVKVLLIRFESAIQMLNHVFLYPFKLVKKKTQPQW